MRSQLHSIRPNKKNAVTWIFEFMRARSHWQTLLANISLLGLLGIYKHVSTFFWSNITWFTMKLNLISVRKDYLKKLWNKKNLLSSYWLLKIISHSFSLNISDPTQCSIRQILQRMYRAFFEFDKVLCWISVHALFFIHDFRKTKV